MNLNQIAQCVAVFFGFYACALVEQPSQSVVEPDSHYYVMQSFFDLETLLESSDELREQFSQLSPEEKESLWSLFELFNRDIQASFQSLIETYPSSLEA